MHRNKIYLVIYMCLTMLLMQWSGMHYHVGIDEHSNELHIGHVHVLDMEDHGHSHDNSDFDVSFFELSANWFKQIQNALMFTLAVILFITAITIVFPPPLRSILHQRHSYLRPILRGPPILH